MKKVGLKSLVYFATNRCNARCPFCFYRAKLNTPTRELSISELRRVSQSLGPLKELLLSGGEPTLHPKLAEICSIFHKQNQIRHIHLPTNGLTPERISTTVEEILTECPRVSLRVCLNVPGLPETADAIFGMSGALEKVEETSKRLTPLRSRFPNLRVSAMTVATKSNLPELSEIARLIESTFDVSDHSLMPARKGNTPGDLADISASEVKTLYAQFKPAFKRWHLRSEKPLQGYHRYVKLKYLYRLYERILRHDALPFQCRAGEIIAVLEPNGDVRVCEARKVIGNVLDFDCDMKKALVSESALLERQSVSTCRCINPTFIAPSAKHDFLERVRSWV